MTRVSCLLIIDKLLISVLMMIVGISNWSAMWKCIIPELTS